MIFISPSEVRRAHLPVRKAPGDDGIPNATLRQVLKRFIPIVALRGFLIIRPAVYSCCRKRARTTVQLPAHYAAFTNDFELLFLFRIRRHIPIAKATWLPERTLHNDTAGSCAAPPSVQKISGAKRSASFSTTRRRSICEGMKVVGVHQHSTYLRAISCVVLEQPEFLCLG